MRNLEVKSGASTIIQSWFNAAILLRASVHGSSSGFAARACLGEWAGSTIDVYSDVIASKGRINEQKGEIQKNRLSSGCISQLMADKKQILGY